MRTTGDNGSFAARSLVVSAKVWACFNLLAASMSLAWAGDVLAVEPVVAPAAAAELPEAELPKNWRADLQGILSDLDSDGYEVRAAAAARLEQLAARTRLQPVLATELQGIMRGTEISVEVRDQLETFARRLPTPTADPAPELSLADVQQLIERLESSKYNERSGAELQLRWALNNPRTAVNALPLFKSRLAAEDLTANAHSALAPLAKQARATWLSHDVDIPALAEVSDQELRGRVDMLGAATPDALHSPQWRQFDAAKQDLLDILTTDAGVVRVQRAIQVRREAGGLDPFAEARLDDILEWTQPAMCAEIWYSGKLMTQQYLLVGVAQRVATANRPTHFDRIDDQTAHCVSGNSLLPGDYSVGVAFAATHPEVLNRGTNMLFHLVNLPTPRRRLAYEMQDVNTEPRRLAELTERTWHAMIRDQRLLTDREMTLLPQMDPATVGRMAGDYLLAVDDRAMEEAGRLRPARVEIGSYHSAFCLMLSSMELSEAGPAIVRALKGDRFYQAPGENRGQWGWISVLRLAQDAPWEGAQQWLASEIGNREPLSGNPGEKADIGATAAALLFLQHGLDVETLGLEIAETMPLLKQLDLEGYRFTSDDARTAAIRRAAELAPASPAGVAQTEAAAGR